MDIEDKYRCSRLALGALEEMGIATFPIQVPDLVSRIQACYGIKSFTYRQGSALMGGLDALVNMLHSNDAATIQLKGRLFIFYNSSQAISQGRRRFTVAHELGHCLCGHFEHPAQDDAEARDYERQADYFASVLLSPGEAALAILAPYRISVYSLFAVLRGAFGLSREAAYYRSRELLLRTIRLQIDPKKADLFDLWITDFWNTYDQAAMDALTDAHRDEYEHVAQVIRDKQSGQYTPVYVDAAARQQYILQTLKKLFH